MDIIVQTVILFLGFDKSRDDFIVVGNSSSLFDLVESVFNNLDVSQILFHKLSFFFVSLSDSLKSHLKNNNWIGELMSLVSISWIRLYTFIFKFNDLILFLKSNLKRDNFTFKSIFFFLMLGLKSNDLIICFLSNFTNCLIILILNLSFFLCFLDFFVVTGALSFGAGNFFSKHINLSSELLVLSFSHIQSDNLSIDLLL